LGHEIAEKPKSASKKLKKFLKIVQKAPGSSETGLRIHEVFTRRWMHDSNPADYEVFVASEPWNRVERLEHSRMVRYLALVRFQGS
jgi:hypothetical protein